MACSDIATITVNGKESKMQVTALLGILNGAACHDIDGRQEEESKTLGDLVAHKGLEEESLRNALMNYKMFEEEIELIESIKTELGIG